MQNKGGEQYPALGLEEAVQQVIPAALTREKMEAEHKAEREAKAKAQSKKEGAKLTKAQRRSRKTSEQNNNKGHTGSPREVGRQIQGEQHT